MQKTCSEEKEGNYEEIYGWNSNAACWFGHFAIDGFRKSLCFVRVTPFHWWVEAMLLPEQDAKTTAEAFVTHFVTKFGAPMFIHMDQGCNFEAELFREIG